MIQRSIKILSFSALTVLFYLLKESYHHPALTKGFYTAVALTVIYALFRAVIEPAVNMALHDAKARYMFRKANVIICMVVIGIVTLRIWIINPQALLVAYGLVGAGVAVALQDLFKNFVGGLILFTRGIYQIGDRIDIRDHEGDIIDVGLMYTTLMEIKQWVGGDQVTGRMITLPNGMILNQIIQNYTKDFPYIWDEITIPITYGSDNRLVQEKMLAIVKQETADAIEGAKKMMSSLEQKYFFSQRAAEPEVFMQLTDNWVSISLRYVTPVKERRRMNTLISRRVLEEFKKSKNIQIASETLEIVRIPPVKIKRR